MYCRVDSRFIFCNCCGHVFYLAVSYMMVHLYNISLISRNGIDRVSTRGATVESLAVAESTRGEVYYFNQSENDNCHRRALTACSFCQGVSGIFMAVSSVTLQPVNYGQYVGNIILASM